MTYLLLQDPPEHSLHASRALRGQASTGTSGKRWSVSGSAASLTRETTKRIRRLSGGEDGEGAKDYLLLLLNHDTWLGEAGIVLAERVRMARAMGFEEIVMVHENDPARGGCEFARFFSTTPQDLIEDGLYGSIAIALHAMPHREVSMCQVALACGAKPSASKSAMAKEGGKGRRNTTAAASLAKRRQKHRQRQAEDLKMFEAEEKGEKESSAYVTPKHIAVSRAPSVAVDVCSASEVTLTLTLTLTTQL